MIRVNRKFSILGVVVLMVITVMATVAVSFAKQDEEGSNGKEKVTLCHKGKNTITVGAPAVKAHLAHGDVIGPCSDTRTTPPPDGTTLTLTTQATPEVTLGAAISDTATLEGATPNATGDITFKLYGPFPLNADPNTDTCVDPDLNAVSPVAGNLVTTLGPFPIGDPDPANNGAYVVSSGDYDPEPPLAPGRYQWVASYSGDPNDPQNEPVSSECKAEGEQSVVNEAPPTSATEGQYGGWRDRQDRKASEGHKEHRHYQWRHRPE
jgi:hypothetical protein